MDADSDAWWMQKASGLVSRSPSFRMSTEPLLNATEGFRFGAGGVGCSAGARYTLVACRLSIDHHVS